ncbi:hypothetical protein EXIGLDRAFT_779006 [Exidia glandulosa HHB12029]|uniref:Uncharacterized protein n=1 Tax=Exidia glandulosa HHB12029 TaxID=1314781 RepID=A0A165C9D1_EXIGL|nr:hypothetical protein EXIGLDRAFT_779006 [Exidia glandulosa HHB12029]
MDALNELLLSPSFSDSMPSDDEEEVEHLMELCLAHGPKPDMEEDELEADAASMDAMAGDCVVDAALQPPYTSTDADSDGSDTDTDSVTGGGSDADESASEADDNSDSELDDDMVQSGAYTRRSPASDFFVTIPKRRRDDVEEDAAHRLAKRQRYTTPPVEMDPDFGELMKLLANAKESRVATPTAYDGPRTPQAQITHSLFKFARHD